MKRLERLTALLSQLQSRRFTRVAQLSEKFNISERTVYRDLRALEEAGVPLGFEHGQGYYVLDRHFLPPLAFTHEEARSFVFVEELARKYTDPELFRHFSSALEKIKNKLRDQQLTDVEEVQHRVKAYIDDDYTPRFLSLANTACALKQVLRMHYTDYAGKKTIREIEPIGLSFYSQSWHLIAFCLLRQDFRDFSLLRVKAMVQTGKTFEPCLSLEGYIKMLQAKT